MININELKKEVYKNERKKLYQRTLLINILLIVIISISFSGISHNQKEKELMQENLNLTEYRDSLKHILVVELKDMKDRENKIIRSALNLSEDTSYNHFNPNSDDIYQLVKNQSSTLLLMDKMTINKWDSIKTVPVGSPISLADLYRISDEYGWRKHPILKRWVFHEGTDLSAKVGVDVMATSNGVVETVIKSKRGYGNRVVINHGYGYKTVYAHLLSFNVKTGQEIKRGDVIGKVGNTGRSTGPHLHYEVLVNNRPVNPQQFFYIGDQLAEK